MKKSKKQTAPKFREGAFKFTKDKDVYLGKTHLGTITQEDLMKVLKPSEEFSKLVDSCSSCGNTEEPCMCASGDVGPITDEDKKAILEQLAHSDAASNADFKTAWPDDAYPEAAARWVIRQHLLWAAWWAFTLLCLGSLTALIAFR